MMKKRFLAFALIFVLLLLQIPMSAYADYTIPGLFTVKTGDREARVKGLDLDYVGNVYLSLRDLATALSGTEKAFAVNVTKSAVEISLGAEYVPAGGEGDDFPEGEDITPALKRNEMTVNGRSVRYYTLIYKQKNGVYDCFMSVADAAMILDLHLEPGLGKSYSIVLTEGFTVSAYDLLADGYFNGVNAVLVGDATTDDIYFEYNRDVPCAVASTSKLMTYLLVTEAMLSGKIHADDMVTVTEGAQQLSESADGVLKMTAGEEYPVEELLYGMLLASSNEAAYSLGVYVSGSEKAFALAMNNKANELSMYDTYFYNSNGLPVYTDSAVPSKLQNRMSAGDMFKLVSYILKFYPQIKQITSVREYRLETFGVTVKNTNPLLYNLKETTGLKTGTTNRAGACLVTTLKVGDRENPHDLTVIMFGAENSAERGRVSELLCRYALTAYEEGAGDALGEEYTIPATAGEAIDRIVRYAVQKDF